MNFNTNFSSSGTQNNANKTQTPSTGTTFAGLGGNKTTTNSGFGTTNTGFGSTGFGTSGFGSTGFGTSGFGSTGFGTSGFGGFGLNQQNTKPQIQENWTLAQIEEESKKNPDLKQALFIIIELNDLVNQNEQKKKPLEGAEALEKKLIELEDDTHRALKHTIMSLAQEIDHGNEIISEYSDKLTMYRRDEEYASRDNHELPSPFLTRYVESLEKRENNITQAVNSFDEYLNSQSTSQSSQYQQTPQSLIYVLQQQKDAIIRCSTRISQIKEKSEELQKKIKSLFTTKNLTNENDEEKTSVSKSIMEAYDKFQKKRISDLENRDTDRDKFKKPQPKSTGFGGFGTSGFGGFGTGTSGFGGFGKTNTTSNTTTGKTGTTTGTGFNFGTTTTGK